MIGANIRVPNVSLGGEKQPPETRLPSSIAVSGTGTAVDTLVPYWMELNGRQAFKSEVDGTGAWAELVFNGTFWQLDLKVNPGSTAQYWNNASTDIVPPKTGWTVGQLGAYPPYAVGSDPAPTLAYSGWVGIDENPENGTTYAPESFTDNGDGTATIITTDNSGGGFTFRDGASAPPFDNSSGKTYEVRYRLTGSSTTAIRIRSVSGTDGNSANTDSNLNIASATIDGAWHTVQFTANGATDSYLQVGASTTGNFNLLVEVLVKRIL